MSVTSSTPSGAATAELPRRAAGWTALHALLWAAVGAAAVVAIERARPAPSSLADLADDAAARMAALRLDDSQRQALADVRSEWREQVVAEETAWQERIAAAAAAADRRIESLLTPEQARAWRDLAVGVDPK